MKINNKWLKNNKIHQKRSKNKVKRSKLANKSKTSLLQQYKINKSPNEKKENRNESTIAQ